MSDEPSKRPAPIPRSTARRRERRTTWLVVVVVSAFVVLGLLWLLPFGLL